MGPSLTREEALEDGILLDVTPLAKEEKFNVPVAISTSVCKFLGGASHLDTQLLRGLLVQARIAIRQSKPGDERARFRFATPEGFEDVIVAVTMEGAGRTPVVTLLTPYGN